MESKFVVLFDFDWSLVNENSDTWVIKELCPELGPYMRHLMETQPEDYGKGKWTQLMDHVVMKMQVEYNISIEHIIESLKNIPIFEENMNLIKKLKELKIPMAIVSDANVFYIDTILKHFGFEKDFFGIITNASKLEDGKLRIKPYHDPLVPHKCENCPENLCKSLALEVLTSNSSEMENKSIIYIGDGGGDFCPSSRLLLQNIDNRKNKHYICCRKEWTLHEKLVDYISNDMNSLVLNDLIEYIYAWNDGLDLYNAIIHKIVGCD